MALLQVKMVANHPFRAETIAISSHFRCSIGFWFQGVFSRKMFGFNIAPEAVVGPVIMLGARWVVKNIRFTKF